ncbi:hypothetical protein FDP41_013604 [Naegleria fowleri]|uniref:Zn(2)-C6 fungal-type domain-containing protein n=1 Tax=Naegleria fowleri TaxID=5763 RepID=A0A6A5C3E4_NAEFO|nr:uncharacterized protein FDP41_013604 [Naegleria fowleri]KAF0980390.1 hypothetical protein FDP41_013604 [Naegleria fowleri]
MLINSTATTTSDSNHLAVTNPLTIDHNRSSLMSFTTQDPSITTTSMENPATCLPESQHLSTANDKTSSSTTALTHDVPMNDVAAIQSKNHSMMNNTSLISGTNTSSGSILDILSNQSPQHTKASRIHARKSLDPSVLANATIHNHTHGISLSSEVYYHSQQPQQQQQQDSSSTAFSPRFSRQFSQPLPFFHTTNMMMNQNSNSHNNNIASTLQTSAASSGMVNQQQQQLQEASTSLSDDEEGTEGVSSQNHHSSNNNNNNNSNNGSARRVNYACTECRKAHKACSGERPCDRCKKLGMEDKCKSSVRKKRILTKRYWVHFMSNGSSTASSSADMMDDNSVQSPATTNNTSNGQLSFPNLNLNVVNNGSTTQRSSSMNYKRHSSATLPSYNSIRRLNAGLSGGSSTSLTSGGSEHPWTMTHHDHSNAIGAAMTMDSSDNNSNNNNRSPQQGLFYHPYKSPRMTNPSEQQIQPQQQQTSSPRGGGAHSATMMNVLNLTTAASPQPSQSSLNNQPLSQPQQLSMAALPSTTTAFNSNTGATTTSSSYPSFPGLEAYKLDQPSPNSANNTNLVSPFQTQQAQEQQHLYPSPSSATSSSSASLSLGHHGKSDPNLLPPPSSLLCSVTTSTSPNISQATPPQTTQATPLGMTDSDHNHHSNSTLHIPPIMLVGDESNGAQHAHHLSPQLQQQHSQLSPYSQQQQQWSSPAYTTTPSSNTSSTTATPQGFMFYGNGSANDLANSPRASSDYLYSPRSDYSSSDFSSLTNSPRFGAGGTDSNSSTPRGLIGSMSGMNINENIMDVSQQQNPFSVTNSQLNNLSTPVQYNNLNGTQRYRGQRKSAQFHHQQLLYDSALNVSGTRKSIAGYLNHAGNRYSLGSFAYSQFHGSAYSNPSMNNNYGNPQINVSSDLPTPGNNNNGTPFNHIPSNKRHSQHFSNNPYNRYSLGPNHELYGLTMNSANNTSNNLGGNANSNSNFLHPTTK